MSKKLYLSLAMIAALAINSFAQNSIPSGPNTNVSARLTSLEAGLARYLEADDDDAPKPDVTGRPRVVGNKSAAVGSSVIVNTGVAEHLAFDLINKKRVENGLRPLAWSDELETVAKLHSRNMAEFQFFSHKGLDSKMVSDRADDARVGRWRSIGENIAFNRGFQDPVTKAIELWMDSPSHRRNLLDENWRESAIGVAVAEDGSYYFTQIFLIRK